MTISEKMYAFYYVVLHFGQKLKELELLKLHHRLLPRTVLIALAWKTFQSNATNICFSTKKSKDITRPVYWICNDKNVSFLSDATIVTLWEKVYTVMQQLESQNTLFYLKCSCNGCYELNTIVQPSSFNHVFNRSTFLW